MQTDITVITTFPNYAWDIYAKKMLQSFVQYWPQEVSLLVELDDNLLYHDVQKILRPSDCVAVGWEEDHAAFVERNKGKDHPSDYRKQAVRFCHKVFAIKRALDAINRGKKDGLKTPRYLVWLDADVITMRKVTMEELQACLPKEGDAVAYLGRTEWPHSECGWLAFDFQNDAAAVIGQWIDLYKSDALFKMEQWDDSWLFDYICREDRYNFRRTNLSPNAKGLDAWEASPMAAWSTHHKGPEAKQKLAMQKQPVAQELKPQRVIIQTKNAIPHEEICSHIRENQNLIREWIRPCKETDEEIVVVSAGPMLIAEDLRKEAAEGKKIICVKHSIDAVKKAGIQPWATILLDPRPHVNDFVKEPDTKMLWFVASQVDPEVTRSLLCSGCRVIGYHASVGAGEEDLTGKQPHAVVSGGSATATRGLYMLNVLGFSRFRLYGYDLCFPDKVNMNEMNEQGQPRYMELSVGLHNSLFPLKRCFWTEPQFIAQFEEINEIIAKGIFNITAFGMGIVPFILKAKEIADLRAKEFRNKILGDNPVTYREFLKWEPQTQS